MRACIRFPCWVFKSVCSSVRGNIRGIALKSQQEQELSFETGDCIGIGFFSSCTTIYYSRVLLCVGVLSCSGVPIVVE